MNSPLPVVKIFPDPASLSQAAAEYFRLVAGQALERTGRFAVALAGGSTPKALYHTLCQADRRAELDWQRVHFFWGDERCVPPDDPDSNYHLAWQELLKPLSIPMGNIHRIQAELAPETAAAHYAQELTRFFGGERLPRFDLVLLGLGEDGHTASLFPGTSAVEETHRWCVALDHNQPPPPLVPRISLTLPVINAARQVTFLVAGSNKVNMLARVLGNTQREDLLPAQRVQPTNGELTWLVDAAAAASLT